MSNLWEETIEFLKKMVKLLKMYFLSKVKTSR